MGVTTLRRERDTNPFLAELRSAMCATARAGRGRSRTLSAPKIKAPRGTFDVLGEQASARAALEASARAILEGAGYERIETPAFEATELFARGVGESTDIVRKEMFTLQRRGRTLADAAPGGHRAGVPGLRRARHAQAPPAREAVVPVELLPPRACPGRALPAVLAGRRGGARLGRSGPRRGVDRAAGGAARRRWA